MNKYYIVSKEIVTIVTSSFLDLPEERIEFLDNNSIIVYTEKTLEELKEYIKQIPPKIPY